MADGTRTSTATAPNGRTVEAAQWAKALRAATTVTVHSAEDSAPLHASIAALKGLDPPASAPPHAMTAIAASTPTAWADAVADLKREVGELDDLCALVVRKVLSIAERVGALQRWHAEQKRRDPESVPASFVQGLADALERTDSHVEQWLRIFRMAPEVKALIAAHPKIDRDFTAVLAVAREGDAEKAAELVLEYERGGRPAFNDVLDPLAARAKSDAAFRDLLSNLHDPSHTLGGVGASSPLPANLRTQYVELEPFATFGDLRAASKAVVASKAGKGTARPRPTRRGSPALLAPAAPLAAGTRIRIPLDGTPLRLQVDATVRVVERTDREAVLEIVGPGSGPESAEPPLHDVAPAAGAEARAPSTEAAPPQSTPARVSHVVEFTAPAEDAGCEEPDVAAAKARTDAIAAALARIFARPPPGIYNEVSFTAVAADIARAVEAVAIVEPCPATARGEAGYLFTIDEDAGKVRGSVSTRNGAHFAKAEFPVASATACGRFVYPADRVGSFHFLGREDLTFAACTTRGLHGPVLDPRRDDPAENFVSYTSPGGAISEHAHDLYPELFSDPSAKIVTPWVPCSAAVLRTAIEVALPFVGRVHDEPHFRVIQLLAGRHPGRMLAESEGVRVCFECVELAGKEIVLHADHVGTVLDFLKTCVGEVEVASSVNMSFLRSRDRTVGWVRDELAMGVYLDSPWTDIMSVSLARDEAVRRLRQAKGELPKGRGIITVAYSATEGLRFLAPGYRSDMVPASGAGTSSCDLSHRVDLGVFMRLFRGAESSRLELSMGWYSDAPAEAVLRTVEQIEIEGHRCRITRSCAASSKPTIARASNEGFGDPMRSDLPKLYSDGGVGSP